MTTTITLESIDQKLTHLDQKMDTLDAKVSHLDKKVEGYRESTVIRFNAVDERFDDVDLQLGELTSFVYGALGKNQNPFSDLLDGEIE